MSREIVMDPKFARTAKIAVEVVDVSCTYGCCVETDYRD